MLVKMGAVLHHNCNKLNDISPYIASFMVGRYEAEPAACFHQLVEIP